MPKYSFALQALYLSSVTGIHISPKLGIKSCLAIGKKTQGASRLVTRLPRGNVTVVKPSRVHSIIGLNRRDSAASRTSAPPPSSDILSQHALPQPLRIRFFNYLVLIIRFAAFAAPRFPAWFSTRLPFLYVLPRVPIPRHGLSANSHIERPLRQR
jgi:hypothetical protein